MNNFLYIILIISLFLLFLGLNSYSNRNNDTQKQGLNITLLGFEPIVDNNEKKHTRYILVDLYNNQDTSIFLADSLMLHPELVRQYKEKELVGEYASQSLAKSLIEIPPNKRDTFYMSPIFRNVEPDANVFEIFICYYLSPMVGKNKKYEKIKYRIEGYNVKEESD